MISKSVIFSSTYFSYLRSLNILKMKLFLVDDNKKGGTRIAEYSLSPYIYMGVLSTLTESNFSQEWSSKNHKPDGFIKGKWVRRNLDFSGREEQISFFFQHFSPLAVSILSLNVNGPLLREKETRVLFLLLGIRINAYTG